MHRGRGGDYPTAEERAEREGAQAHGYQTRGFKLGPPPRPDTRGHEPHAGTQTHMHTDFYKKKQKVRSLETVKACWDNTDHQLLHKIEEQKPDRRALLNAVLRLTGVRKTFACKHFYAIACC